MGRTTPEKVSSLLRERDRLWEERSKLLQQIKATKSIAERDRLFKQYVDYGEKIDEIMRKLKFSEGDIEAEMWVNGVALRSRSRCSEVLIPFDVFDRIVGWFKSFKDIDSGTAELELERLKLIAEYFEFPLVAFFVPIEELKEMVEKNGKRSETVKKKLEALDKIKEIIEEVYDE